MFLKLPSSAPSASFRCLVAFIVLISAQPLVAQTDSSRLLNDIRTLAHDNHQGRGAGSIGEQNAAIYIASAFKKVGLQPKGDGKSYLQKFNFNKGIHGEGRTMQTANVVAFLDNKRSHTIVIGAHYDHLGTDGQGSSLEPNPADKIHNGADDNASGVAGVLELARYYAGNNVREGNNFLFICFSGEELGLLGSKYFTEHPTVDLSTVNYMINMDMVGRLDRSTNTLFVSGVGTSPVWQPLLERCSSPSLLIRTDSSGVGPSDHTSFYLKDIPVLHFFTGGHSDYHRPSDDWEKINSSGEAKILDVIIALNAALDVGPKLTFLQTRNKSLAGRATFKVTLGIMPSYSATEEGLKVDGVTDGRPAHKAGIQTGDVIIEMGPFRISNIEDYMKALGEFEKGQTVPVKVRRSNEVLTFSVTF